jgi:hypothetical protein
MLHVVIIDFGLLFIPQDAIKHPDFFELVTLFGDKHSYFMKR